ncbi:hypothetical protein CDO52_13500 [Nocardiopsis gilva YIM 90087]|uniref:CDP-alcohol phosphatidyltransferase n=1 Tax=Nocardiopsis gilva YIM 90087 TaxID=1235441 RepID=A0A223SDH7_9ACTN|nr:hypothetical protein CDO52_13500 [Nocardiopsis gilva YIM 90087]
MGAGDGSSRRRTDALLTGLREGGWRPRAWAAFAARATAWSAREAARRPQAAAEATALHAAFLCAARDGRGRARAAASWLLAITHLGMLEGRTRLSVADTLTLLRANLPALSDGAWTGPAALATDFLDGRLARRTGTASPFGAYADALADASFWIPYALRHEPDPRWRGALIGAWVLPLAGATAAAFARGRMVDVPRIRGLHPATAVEAAIVARRLRPGFVPGRPGTSRARSCPRSWNPPFPPHSRHCTSTAP